MAVLNTAELADHSAAILQQLNCVLSSSAFRGSHRSQEFLRHVVELALKGEFDRLKERILGIEIFHRDNGYDTSEDAIVRVSANEVRKRLAQYYAERGQESYHVRLLSGSYVPEFRHVHPLLASPADAPSTPTEIVPTSESTETPSASHSSVTEASPSAAPSLTNSSAAWLPRLPRSGWIAMACVALVCFAAGLFLSGRVLPLPHNLGDRHASPSAYSFYQEMLGPVVNDPNLATFIVVSNPKLFLYRGSNDPNPDDGAAFPFHYALPANLAHAIEQGANDNQASYPYHRLVLDTTDYTGLGEAKSLFGLGALLQALGRPAHLSESRFLNWDMARTEHLIVLGAPHMSAWTENTLAHANFTMDHDQIRNNHPLAGEQAVYVHTGSGMNMDDYGLIWMSQSPSGSRILLLAGLSSTGTAGVGAFFSDPDFMRPVYEELKKQSGRGPFPTNWQVLLHISGRDSVPVKVSAVAVRINPSDN